MSIADTENRTITITTITKMAMKLLRSNTIDANILMAMRANGLKVIKRLEDGELTHLIYRNGFIDF